jgi:hypothetical protein
MLDENLIATLEQSLRQTRNAQHRLMSRLNEVEGEANRLRQEIDALNNSAKQTESAIISLLETMRSGSQNWDITKKLGANSEDDYEREDTRRPSRNAQPPPKNRAQNNNQNYLNKNQNYSNNNQNYSNNNQNYSNNEYSDYPENDYRGGSVAYMNNPRNVPSMGHNIEPISNRFADRTITQACTLLLKEVGKSLHVNELFNLLVAGGMVFKGNNPTISIAVSLNRNRRFRKVAPGTFDLVMRDASQAAS